MKSFLLPDSDPLRIHFNAKDGPLDLVHDQPDIAIHVGSDPSGLMREQELLPNDVCLAARPELLAKHQVLSHPSELSRMPTVAYASSIDTITTWCFYEGTEINSVTIHPMLKVTDGNLLADAVCAGVGIGYLSSFAIREELAAGTLVRVLPDWVLPPYAPITVLTAKTSHGTKRTAVFLKYLQQAAAQLK